MRLYVDDIRTPPEGWQIARNYDEAIYYINTGKVTEVSLDHDLGNEGFGWTGNDVLLWIEREVYFDHIPKPVIHVHTSNPAGRRKMELGIKAIEKM